MSKELRFADEGVEDIRPSAKKAHKVPVRWDEPKHETPKPQPQPRPQLAANPVLAQQKREEEKKLSEEADAKNARDLFSTSHIDMADMVDKKLSTLSNRDLVNFFTLLLRKTSSRMKLEDVIQIKTILTIIYNEKQKMLMNKKKSASGKVKLNFKDQSLPLDTTSGGEFTDSANDYDFV
jgi:hypothetical protein